MGGEPAPTSSRMESQWFASDSMRQPIGHELHLHTRPRHGLAFTIVSLLLVGIAAGGAVFFIAPQTAHAPVTSPRPEPVSTTEVTNAEVPAATPAESLTTPTPTPATPPPEPKVVTPAELQTAPMSPAPATKATRTTAPKPRTIAPEPKTTPAARRPADTALPDLDRAASAAGIKARDEDTFSTPGSEPAPSPPPSSTTPPAPTDTPPDLQLQR